MKSHTLAVAVLSQLMIVLVPLSSEGAFYFTGANLYQAHSNGALNAGLDSRYSTNSADNGALLRIAGLDNPLLVNMAHAEGKAPISFLLSYGENSFSFDTNDPFASIAGFAGLNLFFTDTDGTNDDSFNPSTSAAYVGDLTVVAAVGLAPIPNVFPSAAAESASVQTYNPNGLASVTGNMSSANGDYEFIVGSELVRVTKFAVSSNGVGSFTLKVVATPEPASLGMCALAACGALRFLRRRTIAPNR